MASVLPVRRILPVLLLAVLLSPAMAVAKRPAAPATAPASQATSVAMDRLGVPGPVTFDGTSYALAWSSHPAPTLYKQEYVAAGENVEHYASMLMVDVRLDGPDAVGMVRGIVAQLEARKATDPVANYDVVTNEATGEVMVDFLMSAPGADGQVIVEWTAQRYANRTGGQGTTMLAFSRRAYGDGAEAFLRGLKASRGRDMQALADLSLVPAPAAE